MRVVGMRVGSCSHMELMVAIEKLYRPIGKTYRVAGELQ